MIQTETQQKALNNIKDYINNKLMIFDILNGEKVECIIMEGISVFELRYKHMDMYFYGEYFNFYIDVDFIIDKKIIQLTNKLFERSFCISHNISNKQKGSIRVLNSKYVELDKLKSILDELIV